MAKGQKRTAAAASEEPGAKRVASVLKQHGVSKSMLEGIREIVQHPLADLPDSCRDMLLAMLPWSVCVPSDQRGEDQCMAVEMIQEITASIQSAMQREVEAASAAVSAEDERRSQLQLGIQEAEAALQEANGLVDQRKCELAEASSTLLTQKHALGDAEAAERSDSAALEKLTAQKQELEEVKAGSFQKCKEGDWQPGEEEDVFKPIKALICSLQLDESLATSLPVSLLKKERGAFDQVVVDKFEEALCEKIQELTTSVESMSSSAARNATAVEEARKAFECAQAEQQEVARNFALSQEASASASAKVAEANEAAEAFEPEYTSATAARQEKVDQLESFSGYNAGSLDILVNKISKQKEKADAAALKQIQEEEANIANIEEAAEAPAKKEEAESDMIAEVPEQSAEADSEMIAEVPTQSAEADPYMVAEVPSKSLEADSEMTAKHEVTDAVPFQAVASMGA